jgi:ADP-heptose:LPS heptosyltransferase
MEPNVMRKIDYYIGIPLCFLITILYKLQRAIGMKDPRLNDQPKNVLFIELAEMGSIVVSYPAMREIEKIYPDSHMHFLLFKNIEEVIEILDIIPKENIFTIDNNSFLSLLKDTIKFLIDSRKKKIDTAIIFDVFTRYSAILSYLSGARKMVGFFRYYQEGLYIGDFLSHKVIYNHHIHMSHSYMALSRGLQYINEKFPLTKTKIDANKLQIPKFHSEKKDREKIWRILQRENQDIDQRKKLVIINPNASKLIDIRKWPLENYAQLVKNLLDDEDIYTIIIGVESEKPDAEFICDFVKNRRVLDLTGKTTLTDLLHLLNIANILITNDSGPAHFASLTSIHIVVFFGPETPNIYKPLSDNCTILYSHYACSPCVSAYNQRLSPCNNNICLKDIGVDYVYNVVSSILNKNTSHSRA